MRLDDPVDEGVSYTVLHGDTVDHGRSDEELILDVDEMFG